jgi:biopolymer transport protein ExbB
MNLADADAPWVFRRFFLLLVSCILSLALGAMAARPAAAQQADGPLDPSAAARDDAKLAEASAAADAALAAQQTDDAAAEEPDENAEEEAAGEGKEIPILELIFEKSGPLIWPILGMSLLMVAFGIERLLGLRRRKVLPPALIGGLGKLAKRKGGLDPRQAYRVCQQYPSAAANVIKTMLLKVGRPHSELEHAVSEANDREAARLYANVRWLTLTAGVTPLLGLLGTVLGMIKAFFATASLPTGVDKGQALAEGIYEALVTTAAGLSVAIPAFVLAHLLEGRIQKLFRELDETLLGMMPQLERFEGRLRVSPDQVKGLAADSPPVAAPAREQPATTPK